jgi:probable HAF family extracellular repeat protein
MKLGHRTATRFIICAFVLALSPYLIAQHYTVTSLGDCGGLAYPFGINDIGAVVGYCTNGSEAQRPFLWTPAGGLRNIGTLGGDVANASAINNAGSVVGYSELAGDAIYHAFLWTRATGMQDLGTLGGSDSSAHGINNLGQVVGLSFITGDSEYHAFLWSQATGMQDLGTLPGLPFCIALAINDSGEVAGDCQQALGNNSFQRAFLWTQATGMKDLGTLGGADSAATGINASGEVVGTARTPDNVPHGFYWTQSAGMQEIVTPGSASLAFAVNDSGEVAGVFWPSGAAFVWSKSSGVKKINALLGRNSRWWVGGPYAINSTGQLAADGGTKSNPCCDAFLVTPGK